MARPLRLEVSDGIYHAMARGTARAPIFADDTDRRIWLTILAKVRSRFAWRVLAYCLMGNHYHLLIQIPEANLARGMGHLNSVYAQRHNRRHDRPGPLFAGRYKAPLVTSESHLFAAFRYIAQNPTAGGFCADPADWRWSSYRAMVGKAFVPFLDIRHAFSFFDPDRRVAQRDYIRLVTALEGPEPPADLGLPLLGDAIDSLGLATQRPRPAEVSRRNWHAGRPALESILVGSTPVRIAIAYRDHGYTLREIADHLEVHYSTVSRWLSEWEAL